MGLLRQITGTHAIAPFGFQMVKQPEANDLEGKDADGDARASQSFDQESIQAEYAGQLSRLDKLRGEVLSILEEMIRTSGIKVNNFEHRTKELPSAIEKCRDKDIIHLSDLDDAVGLRIICLFRSDITRIGDLLSSNFKIFKVDDKINTSVDEFGYMSVHYICRLPNAYAGPRYDDIKNVSFEVQVRTVARL